MELEGLGSSLIGKALYVYTHPNQAWIPWEFISGTPYNAKIFLTGPGGGVRCVEAEHNWTAVFSPMTSRDWSCIATIIRALGPNVLLVFDNHVSAPTPGFITFLDNCVEEGRMLLTRIWIGQHLTIPTIPDAIFFPPTTDTHFIHEMHGVLSRLPGRNQHGVWSGMDVSSWEALVRATTNSQLGIVCTDIGEAEWLLFWHKISDSRAENNGVLMKRALVWMHTGMKMMEKLYDA